MSTDLTTPTTLANGIALDHDAILRSLNLNARDPKTQAMLLVCERYGIDPLMKHAVLISGNIYITRDGYLHVAHRSGQFDGIEVLDTDETPTHYTAKVAVYRKDMRHPFTYTGRYPKAERMAKTFGPEMAVKVAEVQALRRAFNVTGVAASDERWDVEPSEVLEAIPAIAADAETGEVITTTTRRPPPRAAISSGGGAPASPLPAPSPRSLPPLPDEIPISRLVPGLGELTPCPECMFTGADKPAVADHLVSRHGWTRDGGKVHPPAPASTGSAPEKGESDSLPGAGPLSPASLGDPAAGEAVPGAPDTAPAAGDGPTQSQFRLIHGALRRLGVPDSDRHRFCAALAGHDGELASLNDLTKAEVRTLIDGLKAEEASVAEAPKEAGNAEG